MLPSRSLKRNCTIFILLYFTNVTRFPGQKKAASEYGPGAASKPASPAKPASAKEEDDDDLDLFGSDDEEDEANEKLKAQRVAEYNAKKAASTFHTDHFYHIRLSYSFRLFYFFDQSNHW